jgi:hypothetical protein
VFLPKPLGSRAEQYRKQRKEETERARQRWLQKEVRHYMQVKVIGIGGIGGALLPILARYLNFAHPSAEITLIDGDRYEDGNGDRQDFPELGNKAAVTAAHLGGRFPFVYFRSQPEYVTSDNVVLLIREDDLVFSCVDNHATRKLVSDRCEELRNVILISGGNELTDGNVQIYIRKEGKDLTLPLTSLFHPEIEDPADTNPGERGCDEIVESQPQLLITNNLIAAHMLGAFYSVWERGSSGVDEIYVDTVTGNARAVSRSKELALAAQSKEEATFE